MVGRIVSLHILAVIGGAAANSFATGGDEAEPLRAHVPPIRKTLTYVADVRAVWRGLAGCG